MYRCSVVMDDISAPWSTWEGFLMNGQLEADSSSLVADWSLFNGTPVSLIKRKMNHRYSSPQEHRAQNLIVIGCVAARGGAAASVCLGMCVNSGQLQSDSEAHGCVSALSTSISWMHMWAAVWWCGGPAVCAHNSSNRASSSLIFCHWLLLKHTSVRTPCLKCAAVLLML